MAKKNDLVKKKNGGVPADLSNLFESDAGKGFEEATGDAYAIPFLQILQKMSPQVDKKKDVYIKGAEAGNLYNTITKEVYDGDDGILFIPCYFIPTWVEWVSREAGGGFVAKYSPSDSVVTSSATVNGRKKNGENDLIDTREHYGLLIPSPKIYTQCLLALTSTGLSVSKQWMTMMKQLQAVNSKGVPYNPPMYSSIYRLKTVYRENDKGDWYQLSVQREGYVEDPNGITAAKAFIDMIKSGRVVAQMENADEEAPF